MPFNGRHQLRLQVCPMIFYPEKDNVLLSPGRAVSTAPACQPVGRTPWVHLQLPATEDLQDSVSCTPAIDPGDAKVWPVQSSQDLLPIPTSTGYPTRFEPASLPCPWLFFIGALGQWRRSRRDVNQVVGDAEDLETIAATSLLGGREPAQNHFSFCMNTTKHNEFVVSRIHAIRFFKTSKFCRQQTFRVQKQPLMSSLSLMSLNEQSTSND